MPSEYAMDRASPTLTLMTFAMMTTPVLGLMMRSVYATAVALQTLTKMEYATTPKSQVVWILWHATMMKKLRTMTGAAALSMPSEHAEAIVLPTPTVTESVTMRTRA
jgi:hypothetical protein